MFLQTLQVVLEGVPLSPESRGVINELRRSVSELSGAQRCLTPPPNFVSMAWPVYIECLKQHQYYLSVEELFVAAKVAQVSLLVFETHDHTLKVVGSTGHVDRSVEIVKIAGSRHMRVRSHFERLLPESMLLQLQADTRNLINKNTW